MNEATKRRWDVGLGIIGPILTVAAILVGVWQFNVGESNRATFDHDSKLWLERLNAYRSVAELAGKVVAHADDAKFGDAVRDFTAAYWGTMILVEDKAVEKAMIDFYVEIREFQEGWGSVDRLKGRVEELIRICRQSTETSEPKT
jgi:hypothetical protein